MPDTNGARKRREQTALGLLIDTALKQHGWSVREAARRTGVPAGTLSHYKVGRIKGNADETLRLISAGLGIPYGQLVAAANVERHESDLDTLVSYYRRLPVLDRTVLVDLARSLTRAARERASR